MRTSQNAVWAKFVSLGFCEGQLPKTLRHHGLRAPSASLGPGASEWDSTKNPAYPLASLSSRAVQVSTPRAWGLCPVLPPGGVLPRFVSLLRRGPEHGRFSRCLRYPQSSSFLPTHRTPSATGGAVRPPEGPGYRSGALPSPAPPRPSAAILAPPVVLLWLGSSR